MNTMGINKNRGRVQSFPIKPMPMNDHNIRGMTATQIRPQMQGGAMLPNNYPMANAGQFIQVRAQSQEPALLIREKKKDQSHTCFYLTNYVLFVAKHKTVN